MTLDRRADLILVATTMLAAAGWIFSKEAIQGLPPFGFIGTRFVLASLFLLPFCYSTLKKVSWGDLIRALGVGCLLGSALLLWIYAISVSDTLGGRGLYHEPFHAVRTTGGVAVVPAATAAYVLVFPAVSLRWPDDAVAWWWLATVR